MIKDVMAFHEAFGQATLIDPSNMKARDLRIRLLEEEVNEYLEAEAESNIVEVADALADIVYIACGTAHLYGYKESDPEQYFLAFDFSPITRSPHIQRPACLRKIITERLQTAFNEYVESEVTRDFDYVRGNLSYVVYAAFETAAQYGIPLHEVFAEVHRSNMSKLGEDGKPIYRADGKILKGPNYFKPDIAKILSV